MYQAHRLIALYAMTIVLALGAHEPSAGAAEKSFNEYMMDAYRMLLKDPERAGRGYSLSDYFTRDLDYGSEKGVIHATNVPLTMCNAAVTETFIEAVNLYAKDNSSWSPQKVMPTELWNKEGFTGLKAHFLSHNWLEYPPLEHIPSKEIPASLKADIKQFQSEEAMAKAIERWGVGERIKFQDARPGDIISFDRTNDRIDGSHTYSGHSVVFLGFLDRNQEILDKYDASKVVGFKYFSSQGSQKAQYPGERERRVYPGGLGERWAYFKGFCPVQPGYQLPSDLRYKGCAEKVDNAQNRARRPLEKSERPGDCCLNAVNDAYGPRVGRFLSPPKWSVESARPRIEKEYNALDERIREFVKNRARAGERVALLANGAVAWERTRPASAARYINTVRDRFGIDLRSAAEQQSKQVSPTVANRLTRVTPKQVITLANRQVTGEAKTDLQGRIENVVEKAAEQFRAAEKEGIPNRRFDATD
jgi:hypothetical protein